MEDPAPIEINSFLSILALCTNNTVRSPICAALLGKRLGEKAYVASAGAGSGGETGASRFTAEVMRELGIDLSAHRPQAFSELEDQSFDLIIALSPQAKELAEKIATRQHAAAEYWEMPEPPGVMSGLSEIQMLEAFRRLRDDLRERIEKRFAQAAG